MMQQQPTYYDATPIFCEKVCCISTYSPFKEEGDERKEGVGKIL
jgi:hypothetical protein